MDLHVEKQCVDQMKSGNTRQFLMLFDAYFLDLYKYAARRVMHGEDIELIVRLTFLDALGQIQNTPSDTGYLMWLYSLAKPRVFDYLSRASFPEKRGLIDANAVNVGAEKGQVDNMFQKLSLEEREIIRLKFFEEVTDGDVMVILGETEGTIGARIYRVFKRAHLLLFGESDARQGVYFGELSGFLSRVRNLENIIVSDAFKLSLRMDISQRIDRRDFAIDVNPEDEVSQTPPFIAKDEGKTGSGDLAKIFVDAVKEMKEEEKIKAIEDQLKEERMEKLYDIFDKFKGVLLVFPAVVLAVVIGIFVYKYAGVENAGDLNKIKRVYLTSCDISVVYVGNFSDAEKRKINEGVSDRLCGHFDVNNLVIRRGGDGAIRVALGIPDWFLKYKFARKVDEWRIKEYERTFIGYKKLRQV
jgi:DNA-directed RNA polymerase specialized sigma24 family protein